MIMAGAPAAAEDGGMIDTIDAWQCIGCGRVVAERPCIGICTDKRVELVQAADYAALAWRVEELESALRLIASVTPKPDALEASWLALQQRARRLLDGH